MPAPPLSARQILDRLVAFPTVSRDSNLALVDWVESDLAQYGVTATRVYNAAGPVAAPFRPPFTTLHSGMIHGGTAHNITAVVSDGTEAGQFRDAGSFCVVSGPGDVAQAHQSAEYRDLSEFIAGWQFKQRLVAELAR